VSQQEGLIVDVMHGDSSTTTSPLTESSLSTTSAAISSLSAQQEKKPIKRRRSAKQVSEARVQAKIENDDYNHRFKLAFKAGTDLVHQRLYGNNPPSEFRSVNAIISHLNREFKLNGRKKLSKSTLYRAVHCGHVGASPLKRGPTPRIPDILMDVVVTHTEVSQVGNGGELRGRDIKRLINAAVTGTKFETEFEMESVWKKLQMRHPDRMQAATKVSMEEARSKWTTVDNLEQWFDDAKVDLIRSGLVINSEVRDSQGQLLSELDFWSDEVRRRIINMDETHHDLSITGDKSGSRALVYKNPRLQRGYKKTVKPGRHVTGVYATNSAGEALPPMYIFDSGAKIESNYRVKMSWLEGLPVIEGKFGCPDRVEVSSFYSVRSRGSMDDSLFNDYVERVVLPLYPNISKTATFDPTGKLLCGPVILKVDSGPGRMIANLESISKRAKFFEQGLLILMGLPNATSVNQEMDALYGAFKSSTYARGEVILTERLRLKGQRNSAPRTDDGDDEEGEQEVAARGGNHRSPVAVTMGFEDLATVVNGKQDDEIGMKPFAKNFTKDKILASWSKVGFVPFTRNCIKSKKVRHELGQRQKDDSLEELKTSYKDLVNSAKVHGLNAGIFDATIPVARPVERKAEEDAQVKQLVETKGSFSAGGLWAVCGTRIGNASVVLRAQKEQLALEAKKVESQSKTKMESRAKLLVNARQALQKYESSPVTMTDKDWIDVIRWVLPKSNADGLLKDLQKRMSSWQNSFLLSEIGNHTYRVQMQFSCSTI